MRLSPEPDSSRWYPGAGLYRNVWLEITGPVHVAHWGTTVAFPEVSSAQATVAIKTELRNRQVKPVEIELRTSIIDTTGATIAVEVSHSQLPASSSRVAPVTLTVRNPNLWDLEHPYRYTLVSEVVARDRIVDRYTTPFGIRRIAFDKQRGLLLNGQALRFHGVCRHHDLGALGAAVNRRATERQLQILKAAGVNAIRTSHNPPSPELLEFADRLGFLVIDEAFGTWCGATGTIPASSYGASATRFPNRAARQTGKKRAA